MKTKNLILALFISVFTVGSLMANQPTMAPKEISSSVADLLKEEISYPDFAEWTARERICEAKTTGCEAIVSACPWCERNFRDAVKENENQIKVYDIVELVEQAI